MSSVANLVYELPHELPNDLRLRILGNKEILGKSQILVEIQPSAQSPFHKLNFGNSSQKTHKSRYQTFLFLSSFTGFLCFVPDLLPMIVGSKFQLQQTILIYGTNFSKKGNFRSKIEKINITIEFFIFELILVPIFSLN